MRACDAVSVAIPYEFSAPLQGKRRKTHLMSPPSPLFKAQRLAGLFLRPTPLRPRTGASPRLLQSPDEIDILLGEPLSFQSL
jgi:hypothetical protein